LSIKYLRRGFIDRLRTGDKKKGQWGYMAYIHIDIKEVYKSIIADRLVKNLLE